MSPAQAELVFVLFCVLNRAEGVVKLKLTWIMWRRKCL